MSLQVFFGIDARHQHSSTGCVHRHDLSVPLGWPLFSPISLLFFLSAVSTCWNSQNTRARRSWETGCWLRCIVGATGTPWHKHRMGSCCCESLSNLLHRHSFCNHMLLLLEKREIQTCFLYINELLERHNRLNRELKLLGLHSSLCRSSVCFYKS